MFTDILLELPIKNYKDYNLVLHGYMELDYNQKGWVEFKHWQLLVQQFVNGLWICWMHDLQWAPSVLSKLKLGRSSLWQEAQSLRQTMNLQGFSLLATQD